MTDMLMKGLFNEYMIVEVKRKELEKLGINLPQMKKLFTHYYISMLLVSDDIEVTSVRLFGKHFVEKYVLKVKKSNKLYEKLKEFYLSKL